MKRLYVVPEGRALGSGNGLIEAIIQAAERLQRNAARHAALREKRDIAL